MENFPQVAAVVLSSSKANAQPKHVGVQALAKRLQAELMPMCDCCHTTHIIMSNQSRVRRLVH